MSMKELKILETIEQYSVLLFLRLRGHYKIIICGKQ